MKLYQKIIFILSLCTVLFGCAPTATQNRVVRANEMINLADVQLRACLSEIDNRNRRIISDLERVGLLEPDMITLESLLLDWYFPDNARDDYIRISQERYNCFTSWQRNVNAAVPQYALPILQFNNEVPETKVALLNKDLTVGEANTKMKASLDNVIFAVQSAAFIINKEASDNIKLETQQRAEKWRRFGEALGEKSAKNRFPNQRMMPMTTRCRTRGRYTNCTTF